MINFAKLLNVPRVMTVLICKYEIPYREATFYGMKKNVNEDSDFSLSRMC